MKKLYDKFCRLEEMLALGLLSSIAVLVFISALMRYVKHPLNWAQDVALVAFAWMIFLGSDIAIRGPGLIGIDLLVKQFPVTIQKGLDILFKLIIIAFLLVLVVNGYSMTVQGWSRQIAALHVSYGVVTMAVPVGALLMIVSTSMRLAERIKTPADHKIHVEGGGDIA